MSVKGTIVFLAKGDTNFTRWALHDVTERKLYPATLYAPGETDDLDQPGVPFDYHVFRDDLGHRVGYSKDPSTDDDTDFLFVPSE